VSFTHLHYEFSGSKDKFVSLARVELRVVVGHFFACFANKLFDRSLLDENLQLQMFCLVLVLMLVVSKHVQW
jgi:hypothetical protein